jgi:arylformamidase
MPRPMVIDDATIDPDGQPPVPFQAALDHARTLMQWAQEAPPPGMRVVRDIAYGADRLQRYDVYAPRGARNAPVLVFWHGGGWTNGYRDYVRFMATHVTRLGMVLVAPSYRLAPAHRMPAPLDDCLAVLATLARDIAARGGAPDRFYLSGHSAGGHLAAMTALRRDRWADAGVPANAIRGCLPISGIMDLYHPAPAPGSLEERVYTTVARVKKSNARMLAMLQAQPAAVSCVLEPGRDHFQTHRALRSATDGWYKRLAVMAGLPFPNLQGEQT